MKVIHTSDWHLGQNFKNCKRDFEHKIFLKWLLNEIIVNDINLLIISGNIFDTINPPNYALKMYHDFLSKISKTKCENIVIIAGNHDSVKILNVSKDLLKTFNIHVITEEEDFKDLIVPIYKNLKLECIVCAAPFLRNSFSNCENLTKKMNHYYMNVYKKAKQVSKEVPLIAIGHISLSDLNEKNRTIRFKKNQNIYDILSKEFLYVALGCEDNAKIISGKNNIRYSGSPIPLSFKDSVNDKFIIKIDLNDNLIKNIDNIKIPRFKKLITIKSNLKKIKEILNNILDKNNPPFVEIELISKEYLENIDDFIEEYNDNGINIISIKEQKNIIKNNLTDKKYNFKKINPAEMFENIVNEQKNITNEEKKDLIKVYEKILEEIKNEN